MRIISAAVTNFASYKELAFDFTEAGLTLIQGATGSGKSTLCDIVPWILFGKTAKGGTVDEILSWPGDKITAGTITLMLNNNIVQVGRRRGKAKDNDLIIWQDGGAYRGKDLADTQKLINNLLGMDCDLYLAGAYFHEFSQTAQFFTTTAKNRRAICEQIVDLSLAKKLQPALSERAKQTKINLTTVEQEIRDNLFKIDTIKKARTYEVSRAKNWDTTHAYKIADLETRCLNFDSDKEKVLAKLQNLYSADLKRRRAATTCSECGAPKAADVCAESIYKEQIEREKAKENTYLRQLEEAVAETNPFSSELNDFSKEIKDLRETIDALEFEHNSFKIDADDIEVLQQVVADYRSASISNTIQDIETQTNQLLIDYFDAECKVNFTVEDSDKLDVIIHKDGNQCSYTQLSKGQRCLLKLCFGVAIMRCVANHNGIKFYQAFFDEALDGLSEEFKAKAFGLLSTLALEYESVYVVEHSEGLKAMFTNSYSVKLVNGESQIGQ